MKTRNGVSLQLGELYVGSGLNLGSGSGLEDLETRPNCNVVVFRARLLPTVNVREPVNSGKVGSSWGILRGYFCVTGGILWSGGSFAIVWYVDVIRGRNDVPI